MFFKPPAERPHDLKLKNQLIKWVNGNDVFSSTVVTMKIWAKCIIVFHIYLRFGENFLVYLAF